MKAYGYKKNSEEFVELQELSVECTIEQLNLLIRFLQETRDRHKKALGKTEICHSHYRDWNKNWSNDETDIIIITKFIYK